MGINDKDIDKLIKVCRKTMDSLFLDVRQWLPERYPGMKGLRIALGAGGALLDKERPEFMLFRGLGYSFQFIIVGADNSTILDNYELAIILRNQFILVVYVIPELFLEIVVHSHPPQTAPPPFSIVRPPK